MATGNYAGVKHVVKLSSDVGKPCEHCDKYFKPEELAESINHYIGQHGYMILHIGQETTHDADGHPWQSTIAVVGR